MTPIQDLNGFLGNHLFIKREDLIPYSFGGNKARKGILFFQEIDKGDYDTVVTYGSSHSNHCRVVANMAAAREMRCIIIEPESVSEETFNSHMMKLFGAEIITVPVDDVHETIESKLKELRTTGKKPYFIPGGGHGNIGTQAYVDCYKEIKKYEKDHDVFFDYIFFASGTGTTQAGLVCGQILNNDTRKIVGISIARKCPRGRNVVIDSIISYLGDKAAEEQIQENTVFVDSYTGEGYGKQNECIRETIETAMKTYGIPLDETYTGKAFWGMNNYLKENKIENKNILFVHTGGMPLFFDYMKEGMSK